MVGARSVLGPLLGCLVPGRQTPPQRGAGRVPTSQAPARPDSLLPRHVRVPARTGAVAGRQGPSRVVGAAGPPYSLSRRASPSGHAARRWGAATARRAPKPGQRGSRRWRRHRLRVRREEARHRRRVHQAQHEAAKQVIAFAVRKGVGTLLVGDPKHITSQNVGRVQNLRLRQWRRTHLVDALRDKAERAGMIVRMVDERGSSSTCPVCRRKVPKPKGRRFSCPHCQFQGHRDLVGAANIAATHGGGPTSTALPVLVEHRRAGIVPARRDRRRHQHDRRRRRSCLASGHPAEHQRSAGCRSPHASTYPAPGEDQATRPNRAPGC